MIIRYARVSTTEQSFRASVGPAEARNVTVRRFGRSGGSAQLVALGRFRPAHRCSQRIRRMSEKVIARGIGRPYDG
jgi:hypothetical protein